MSRPDLDAIEARVRAMPITRPRISMRAVTDVFALSADMRALLAYCRRLEAVVQAVRVVEASGIFSDGLRSMFRAELAALDKEETDA